MAKETERPVKIVQLPEPDMGELVCPYCESSGIVRSHSRWREVLDLGTKHIGKLLEFESIHLKCKSCTKIFPFEREEILPVISISKDVLDTILTFYFDFGHSERTVVKMLEYVHSVKVSRESVHNWIKKYGKDYCEKNIQKYKEGRGDFSGCMTIDGTFSPLNLDKDDKIRVPNGKKKTVSWLQLTQLPDGTLVAIWEEEKTKKK